MGCLWSKMTDDAIKNEECSSTNENKLNTKTWRTTSVVEWAFVRFPHFLAVVFRVIRDLFVLAPTTLVDDALGTR